MKLVGGVETWKGQSHTHSTAIKNQVGYLCCGGPTWGARGPSRHWPSQPRAPVPGRRVSTTSGCENQQELHSSKDRGLLESQAFLLRGLHTDLLAHELTHSGLQGSSSKIVPGRYEEEIGAGGQDSSLQRHMCWQAPMPPLVSPPPPCQSRAGGCHIWALH